MKIAQPKPHVPSAAQRRPYFHLRFAICCLFLFFIAPAVATASSSPAHSPTTVILVIGAPGDAEFGTNFLQQAEQWEKVCAQARLRRITIGLSESDSNPNDHDRLKQALLEEPKDSSAQLWLVLIGHGTFDGKEARFNLRGPDVSAAELANWFKPFRRPLAIINTASSSAPFVPKLSGTNRVVISATRSGSEQNFARFGQYLAAVLGDPQADIDHDGEVSLLEAFLVASRHATEFYKQQGRLVTEHALIDDNGDARGTPADWFQGLRPVKQASDGAALDGLLAQQFRLLPSAAELALTPEQLTKRDELERAVVMHREKKSRMAEDEYYAGLETILVQLAQLYASAPATNSPPVQ